MKVESREATQVQANSQTLARVDPEIPEDISDWRGVLWINRTESPWRRESDQALKLLGKTGFTIYVFERSGIGGPEFQFNQRTYSGIDEIKGLVVRFKTHQRPKP